MSGFGLEGLTPGAQLCVCFPYLFSSVGVFGSLLKGRFGGASLHPIPVGKQLVRPHSPHLQLLNLVSQFPRSPTWAFLIP